MHESEAWGYSEASSASVCSIATYWLQIYLFNSETVWNKRQIKFNPPPEEEYYSLISRSTWNLNTKWATSCWQNARQKLNKIQRIQEVFITNYENVRKTPQHFLSTDNGWQFQETSIQGQNRIKHKPAATATGWHIAFIEERFCAGILEQNTRKRTTRPLLFPE